MVREQTCCFTGHRILPEPMDVIEKRLLEAVECIDLIIQSPDEVERFEGGDNGKLPDLFNDLLTKEVYPCDTD